MKALRGFAPAHADWDRVLQLDKTEMQYPWTLAQWQHLDPKHDVVFLHHKDDQLVAFALYRLSPLENLAHLLKIVVNPTFRGNGVALEFWKTQVDQLRIEQVERIYLEVAANNERALGFYRKLGFSFLHRIHRFYQDGTDAWTMEKQLDSSI